MKEVQEKDPKYTVEGATRLFEQIRDAFWKAGETRTERETDTFLYDLINLYPYAPIQLLREMEDNLKRACLLETHKNQLLVMLRAYHTVTREARNTPLYNVIQNLITETADTLADWHDILLNETPSASMNEEHKAKILPGTLRNVALQMILLKGGNSLDDVAMVVRESRPGSKLHTTALLKETMMRTPVS